MRRRLDPRPLARAAAALALAAGLAACAGAGRPRPPDDEFGHRYGGVAPDGRETVLLAPPDSNVAYVTLPAVLDSVVVRPARAGAPAGAEVAVEALVKGTLPDACTVLDEAVQERASHLVRVTLTMRQPHGALCAQVVRPFRFYLPLTGAYAPGSYTLFVNGVAYPFRIRAEGGG